METRTITCPCGASVVISQTTNVGAIMKETHYQPVFDYHGNLIYLCPVCFRKAQALAAQLVDIIKSWDFYLPNLRPPGA